MLDDITDAGSFAVFQNIVTKTASFNSTAVDMRDYVGRIEVQLLSAAGTGTSPTMDVKLQASADNSTFADISGATFTQLTTSAGNEAISVDIDSAARYVRAVATIGGTSPSYIYSVVGYGVKKTA